MYLEVYILSYLMVSPQYGYELKKKLIDSVGSCMTVSNNTLYPILRRYEKTGAAVKEVEMVPGKPPRNIYTLTDLGRELFVEILWHFPDRLMEDREEFCARLSLFSYMNPEARRRALTLRGEFLGQARGKIAPSRAYTPPLKQPYGQKMLAFFEGILDGEEELIDFYSAHIDDPCLLDESGQLLG